MLYSSKPFQPKYGVFRSLICLSLWLPIQIKLPWLPHLNDELTNLHYLFMVDSSLENEQYHVQNIKLNLRSIKFLALFYVKTFKLNKGFIQTSRGVLQKHACVLIPMEMINKYKWLQNFSLHFSDIGTSAYLIFFDLN